MLRDPHSKFYSVEILHGITLGAMVVAGYVWAKTRGQSHAQQIEDEREADAPHNR